MSEYGEPWRLFYSDHWTGEDDARTCIGVGTSDADDPNIVVYEQDEPSPAGLVRLDRMVACVNACEGIDFGKMAEKDITLIGVLSDAHVAFQENKELKAAKDTAYSERNKLVHLLSSIYPSWLAAHPESDKDWDPDWRWIVFIQLPTGQCSWHIHISEATMFSHLRCGPVMPNECWDGHTTEEKYARVARAAELAGRARTRGMS